jgi:CRP/FNR family cyclic AMP-dependent transcriptional regulator
MGLLNCPAGAVIYHAGDPSASAFLIREGAVELLRGGPAAVRVAHLGPGEVFGEMSLVDERPHALTARAVTDVRLSSLTRSEFELLLTADPAAFRVYLGALLERLRCLAAQAEAAQIAAPPPGGDTAVRIHPLTRRAAATLPAGGLPVEKYPFRIGRAPAADEEMPLDVNDLWLIDQCPFHVSRNHALLERAAGAVVVKDRGSALGVFVNDVHIGGKSAGRQAALEDGDNVLVLGGRMSPYQFRVEVTRR